MTIINAIETRLPVSNVRASAVFYEGVLGSF
jgi:hypothetical protein